jgi:hypothetical protein
MASLLRSYNSTEPAALRKLHRDDGRNISQDIVSLISSSGRWAGRLGTYEAGEILGAFDQPPGRDEIAATICCIAATLRTVWRSAM